MHLRIIQEELLELNLKQFHIEEALVNHHENNKYIIETLELNGSAEEGDALFKINCVGCHGITARGLVGPDLHSITQRLNDKEIIKQVTGGLTPPMPSFEIDPVNMANLLKYLHSLE